MTNLKKHTRSGVNIVLSASLVLAGLVSYATAEEAADSGIVLQRLWLKKNALCAIA